MGSWGVLRGCAIEAAVWFKQHLYVHRNHKLNKWVQETQKQYAYLSVDKMIGYR